MIEFHPLANLFPLIEGDAFGELAADVGNSGVREALVIHELKILDGRNRYRAAIEAGLVDAGMNLGEVQKVGIPIRFYDAESEGDPLAFVLSLNLHRRHLTESQRAMIAAEIATLKQGRPSEWNRNREDGADNKAANRPDLSQADAAELLNVSERNVRRGRAVLDHGSAELVEAVRNDRIAISAAAEVAKLSPTEQLEVLRQFPPHQLAKAARERVGNGGRATQASRVEPADSLDFFPTPPWATRALFESVLGVGPGDAFAPLTAWEPACGEGHISGVLEEYFGTVIATDIFDYSADGRSAPGWQGTIDFLADDTMPEDMADGADVDWIITNPPFRGDEDRALLFALRALPLARMGVALFVRTQWLEGIERYTRLFAPHQPTVFAQFAERVSLFSGAWDPTGSKPDQYCWLVWIKGEAPRPTLWIPPGRKAICAEGRDVERFTAHPVMPTPDELRAVPVEDSLVDGDGGAVAPQGAAAEGEGSDALPRARLTKAEAEPILRVRYATTDVHQLSAEFGGVPVNTIRSWAFHLGLTDASRRGQQLAERNRARGKHQQEPNNAA